MNLEAVKAAIRDIPDFPKKGILFKDVTPVLSRPELFRAVIDCFEKRHRGRGIDYVAAIEARGFLFGSALAERLHAGIIPIRKKGKLPYQTVERSYELEYGVATLQMHVDAVPEGARVLLVDDLLATGGTARAAAEMITAAGGQLLELDFLIELAFLKGREKLRDYPVYCPIVY